eukprot:241227-Rhodomonas_salina.1
MTLHARFSCAGRTGTLSACGYALWYALRGFSCSCVTLRAATPSRAASSPRRYTVPPDADLSKLMTEGTRSAISYAMTALRDAAVASGAMCLRSCYGVPGTEGGYGGTRQVEADQRASRTVARVTAGS